MKISSLSETTTAGSVAPVAQPVSTVQKRMPKGSNLLKGIKTSAKYANSLHESAEQSSDKSGEVASYIHSHQPEIFTRYGDEYVMGIIDKVISKAGSSHVNLLARMVVDVLKRGVLDETFPYDVDHMNGPIKRGGEGLAKVCPHCNGNRYIWTNSEKGKTPNHPWINPNTDTLKSKEIPCPSCEGGRKKVAEASPKQDLKHRSHTNTPQQLNEASPLDAEGFSKEFINAVYRKFSIKHDAIPVKMTKKPVASDLGKYVFISRTPGGKAFGAGMGNAGGWSAPGAGLVVDEGGKINYYYEPATKVMKRVEKGTYYAIPFMHGSYARVRNDQRDTETKRGNPTPPERKSHYEWNIRVEELYGDRIRAEMTRVVDDIYANLRRYSTTRRYHNADTDQENALKSANLLDKLSKTPLDKHRSESWSNSYMERYLDSLGTLSHGFASVPTNQYNFEKIMDTTPNGLAKYAKFILNTVHAHEKYVKDMLHKPIVDALGEADKHSFVGKIQRGHELKKKVDSTWNDIGDAQKKGDKEAGSKAFRKHERYANLERPGTWTKVDEEEIQENDLVLAPGTGRQYKPGLLAKPEVSANPTDSVKVDVPLLIRLLEYAKEDAPDDMALHALAEKLVAYSARGKTLSMKYYDLLVPAKVEPEVDEGLAGAVVGGVAGAAITKSPGGAMTGAELGSSVQDMFSGDEEVDEGKWSHNARTGQKLHPRTGEPIPGTPKPAKVPVVKAPPVDQADIDSLVWWSLSTADGWGELDSTDMITHKVIPAIRKAINTDPKKYGARFIDAVRSATDRDYGIFDRLYVYLNRAVKKYDGAKDFSTWADSMVDSYREMAGPNAY